MSREYPSHPRVGVAAVVLRDNQVLLVQRGREPGKGSWGLPGGMLELGETLAEGTRREVMEECGVEIEVGPLVAVFEPMQRDEDGRLRFHYVVVDYLARYLSGEPRAGDDADDARWVDLDALEQLPMRKETREVIWKAVEMAGRNLGVRSNPGPPRQAGSPPTGLRRSRANADSLLRRQSRISCVVPAVLLRAKETKRLAH